MKPSNRDFDKARVIHGIIHDVRLTDKESVKEVARYIAAERASFPESIKLTLKYYEASYPELNAKFAIEDLCNWMEGK